MVWVLVGLGYIAAALLLCQILKPAFDEDTGHWTLCGDCNRFSPEEYCPYC